MTETTIAGGFQSWREVVAEDTVPPDMFVFCRHAFYAGAFVVLQLWKAGISREQLQAECDRYYDSLSD